MAAEVKMADSDFLYENAPLVEVVAEFHWELVPIEMMPGMSIDPLFVKASEKFTTVLTENGFGFIERLVPPNIPTELVSDRPVLRFRQAENKWPLFQIGPGVFTANITPPYEGWGEFRQIIEFGVTQFDEIYSLGSTFATLTMLQLRYLDAFTQAHRLKDYRSFMADELNLPLALSDDLVMPLIQNGADYDFMTEVKIPLERLPGASLVFKASPGMRDNQQAALLDLRVIQRRPSELPAARPQVMDWMDNAHQVLRMVFQSLTSPALKEAMGPERKIGS